eukprot:SAG31_NODE_815_length_11876_cov_2.189182_6_plen_88_part_00
MCSVSGSSRISELRSAFAQTFPAYIYYKLAGEAVGTQSDRIEGHMLQQTRAQMSSTRRCGAAAVCVVSLVLSPVLVAIQIYQMLHPT